MANQSPAERDRRIVIRAGLFVGLGLLLAGLVIFLIGKERNLFDKQVVYFGAFENVDGLVLGAPVRLGGLQVGRVTKISFAPDLGDKRIMVTMEVATQFRDRIRRDSVARVTGRGVLGDKAVDISLGSPEAEAIAGGGEITLDHLPAIIAEAAPADRVTAPLPAATLIEWERFVMPLVAATRQFEEAHLRRAIAATGGKRVKAAELLGISRKSLWEKMRIYDLDDTAPKPPG